MSRPGVKNTYVYSTKDLDTKRHMCAVGEIADVFNPSCKGYLLKFSASFPELAAETYRWAELLQ